MHRPALALAAATLLASVSARATPPPIADSPGTASRAPLSTGSATSGLACPGDSAVWVNARSKAYHLRGDKFFGHTKHGKFMCKKAADAAGDHPIPSKN